MSPAFRRLLAFLLCLFPSTALAQSSITTSTVLPVPIGGPWVVPMLTMLLIAGAWWVLRSRGLRHAGAASVALTLAIVVGAAGALHALTLEFSNPEGETVLVPIFPEFADEHIGEWDPVDFTNNSGQELQIVDVTAPDFEECVDSGLNGVVLEGSPELSPYPLCEVDAILAPGETCRVDVDAMCRTASLTGMATLTSVEPFTGDHLGGTLVTIYGTNLSTADYVMFGGVGATIVGTPTDTSVTVITPPHAPGMVNVTVITFVGGPTRNSTFAYVEPL